MPKFSVIIPVYQVEAYLRACLDSVLSQKCPEGIEIILVDDGSPDGSGAICDEYAARFDTIRVLHTENRGVSRARNLGICTAEGEYILFLDADDVWEPGLMAELSRLAEKAPDVMVFGNLRLTEDGSRVPGRRDPVIPCGESGLAYLHKLFNAGAAPRAYVWCYGFRRGMLRELDMWFREDMVVSEDFELVMRILEKAQHVEGTARCLYCYRIRENSATARLTEKKLMDNLAAKAACFRRHPVPAMANLYGDNALLVAFLPRKEASQARTFLKKNRDIWKYVSQPPLKLGRMLVTLLGDDTGARAYTAIRSAVRRIEDR